MKKHISRSALTTFLTLVLSLSSVSSVSTHQSMSKLDLLSLDGLIKLQGGTIPSNNKIQQYNDLALAIKHSELGGILRRNTENRSAGSWAVKQSVRWVLKHRRDIVKQAEKYIGKERAKRLEQAIYDIDPILREILKYDELAWGTVQNKLAGVIGADLAYWLVQLIQLLSPF